MSVLETYQRKVTETYTITIEGESIETTDEHPFFTVDNGWTCAKDLETGDKVELSDGTSATVEDVEKNELDEPITVYNFNVMDYHTYYVGESEVLVHNECKVHGNSKLSTKQQHGYEIYNKETGDVVKTGISGQKLNINKTSPRANSQVNKLNRNVGKEMYVSRIVTTDMPNRISALEWEKENALRLWNEGNSMSLHKRPKPWEE